MIGRLTGQLIEKQPPTLVIDVNGVGYELQASMQTFYQLPELNQKTTLFTHLIVREDAQTLYGFMKKSERELFRTLIRVTGVGPKLAVTILSGIAPDAFVACVQAQDSAQLVKIPGVGKKKAERLLLEMRDLLKDWQVSSENTQQALPDSIHLIVQEATQALIALGYKPQDASRAIARVDAVDKSCEDLIRDALKGEMA
ncbi:MAG: Holliday junction ATP-dependent DNA helicase RuvA [marine bacterium B5-7]|nr:MAG: Holliday junction ATP-dependent DNA helicase RuvA [marine bacterium B5-7]